MPFYTRPFNYYWIKWEANRITIFSYLLMNTLNMAVLSLLSSLFSLLSSLFSPLSSLFYLLSSLFSLLSTLYSLLSTLLLSTLYSLLSTLYSLLSTPFSRPPNVNLWLTNSDKQQWTYITFFLNLFYRNIIGTYLSILSLLCCTIVNTLWPK
jgi:hypothetical protein